MHQRWWHNITRPSRDQLIVVVCSMALSLLVIGLGGLKAKRMVRRKLLDTIQLVEKRTAWPVEIGSWGLGPGYVSLEDVRIGPEGNLLISEVTVVPSLNPFSGDFGKPTYLSLGSMRFKGRKQLIQDLTKKFAKSDDGLSPRHTQDEGESGQSGSAFDLPKGLPLTALFRAIPVEQVDLKTAGIDIVDEDGQPVLTVKGLKLRLRTQERKILVRTDSIAIKGAPAEPMVEGRIAVTKAGDLRFFMRRRNEESRRRLDWVVSGTADKSLDTIQLSLKNRDVPEFLQDTLHQVLGQNYTLVTSTQIKAVRNTEGWRFALRAKSRNLTFSSPVISKDPIGPVRFDLTARGVYSLAHRTLTLESARIAVPSREKVTPERSPLELGLSAQLALNPPESEKGWRLAMAVHLPAADCQDLLDAAPRGMVPKIENFKLSGEVTGEIKLQIDSNHPEDTDVSPDRFVWNCQVESEPERYAAERLKQPFMLEKDVDASDEPASRILSPSDPNFRSLRETSPSVPLAFVTSEDAAFFAHKGIDPSAIEGAFKRNLSEGRIAVGGSTITMQTAKNLFLSNDRTISRKLQELFFAWQMERVLSKDRILEIYLNIVEFGPGIFGIVQASRHYFNKEPSDLSLTESAYLASLLPSPKNRYLSFCRGRLTPGLSHVLSGILRRMVNLGRISADRYELAAASPLRFNEQARLTSTACSMFADNEQAQN